MATLEEAKAAFNSLAATDSPEALRTEYADYRIESKPIAYFVQAICYRDIYQFEDRWLGMEWNVAKAHYTADPAARGFEVQRNTIITYTYTEIL